VALIHWYTELFTPIHEALLNVLLLTIEKGRNREVIETSLLKDTIGSIGTANISLEPF
jgi:hypothetical protein